jgi:tetratricopeptide (TPR) repeat protein
LTQDLGVTPSAKIRVEIYDSAKSLARVSPLTVEQIKNSGTIALCKYSRLMLTSPKALLRGYPWLDTISHEFVHYLVTQKGRNAVPIWLQEGLAKFLETRWRGPPGMAVDELSLSLLQDAAKKKQLIPFARMHPSIAMLPTQEQAALAFAEVEAAMRLLYQRGGQPALTQLVAAMAGGMGDEQAVAHAYGKSFQEFEKDWRAEVAKPRSKAASQKSVRPAVAKKLVFKEDAKGKAEPPELKGPAARGSASADDPEAQRAMRLGEIFYARRRWAAAAHEYGRARERLPREVPQVSRRYAFSLAQLGRATEAESALARAVEADPEDEAAQVLYASVLTRQKKYDQAKIALDHGIAVDPFDPDLHAIYVEVAKGLGDKKLEEREKVALALASGRGAP